MKQVVINKLIKTAFKEYDVIADLFFKLSRLDKVKLGKYRYVNLQDILDLVEFYSLIINAEFKKAQSFGQDLDTQVRELIPAYIHNNLIEVENL